MRAPRDIPAPLEAEAVLDWLAEFGATLAHDLNQPLAAAANYLAAARQIAAMQGGIGAPLDQTMDKAAAQISRASAALQRLRAALTPGEPRLRETSLHGLLQAASERSRQGAGAEIEVRLDAADDHALADADQLEQAFANLIEAARETSSEPLTIMTYEAPGAIRIEILAPATDEPQPRAEARAAVGVALARAIVEGHDGRIETMPDGDGFAVTLPLSGADPASATP